MRIVIALDSFKGSLGSAEGGAALVQGLRDADASFETVVIPIADGGEGTIDAIVGGAGGREVFVETSDPLGRPRRASFVLLDEGKTALIELAQASGLILLRPEEYDPLRTTTFGTGTVIRAAIEAGARRIVLAVGGSATNDGGLGLSQALGVRFAGAGGLPVAPAGAGLLDVEEIDTSAVPDAVRETDFILATDVRNPLCGPCGAAFVFAPQKGAGAAVVETLDRGLEHLAAIIERKTGVAVAAIPGTGAGGGVGACLTALFGARIESGFDAVAELINFDAKLAGADLVITGEGKLDAQTLSGKVPLGVARRARRRGIPVFAVAGAIEPEAEALTREGVVGFFPIVARPMALEEAMATARDLVRATGRRIGYLLRHFGTGTQAVIAGGRADAIDHGVTVLPASKEHRAGIIALSNGVFRAARAGRMELEYPLVFAEGNLPNCRVALANGAVISFAGMVPGEIIVRGKPTRIGSFGSVCTHSEWRKRGVGSKVLAAVEEHARRSGIRLFLISGAGGLYDRFGATRAGRFPIVQLPDGVRAAPEVSVRALVESDLEAVEALHRAEATRHVRSVEKLRVQFRRGHVVDRPAAAFLVETAGKPVAYAAFALPLAGKSYDRIIVEEYGGNREALWRALPRIAELLPVKGPLFVRCRSDDNALRAIAAGDGAAVQFEHFAGTVKVFDPRGLAEDLRGRTYATWPPPATRPLPAPADPMGWTKLFFGTHDVDPEETALDLDGLLLPLPLVPYGYDYE